MRSERSVGSPQLRRLRLEERPEEGQVRCDVLASLRLRGLEGSQHFGACGLRGDRHGRATRGGPSRALLPRVCRWPRADDRPEPGCDERG